MIWWTVDATAAARGCGWAFSSVIRRRSRSLLVVVVVVVVVVGSAFVCCCWGFHAIFGKKGRGWIIVIFGRRWRWFGLGNSMSGTC